MSVSYGRVTTKRAAASFVVDPHSLTRTSGRQIDWANVADSYRTVVPVQQTVTVGAAGAAINATTVPVAALAQPIPSGTVLDFGGAKFARLTARAEAGATSLTVAALPTALVSGDAAIHIASVGSGVKRLPAGTVVGDGRTGAGGKISPRAATVNTATGILETEAVEGERLAALTGYGVIVGGVLFENLLPDATGNPKTLATAVKTELNAAGTGFSFEPWGDTRAS